MKQSFSKILLLIAVSLILFRPQFSQAYGLLAHEAIIDISWEKSIQPLLKHKFPHTSDSALKEAHAYVYGGAIVPDIGYYPLGSVFFTHMVHYVRSGDFVKALLTEAEDINEYAFALGVLSHYTADTYGHPLSTNRALPILFPKLKKKYGDEITYEEAPAKHVRVEFGFDVIQTAKGNYVRQSYHDFIGFKISQPVLERAFLKTYGIELKQVFPSVSAAIETFRFIVKGLFPELTKAAWKVRESAITKANPLATEKSYRYKMKKTEYNKEFGKPSIYTPVVMLVLGILPKVGPFEKFKYKVPNEEVEKLFEETFQVILTHYTASLKKLHSEKDSFGNYDLDTGEKTAPGEYKIADKSYYKLLKKLNKKNFEHLNEPLKNNVLAFYSSPETSKAYPHGKWKKITKALKELKASEPDSLTSKKAVLK